MFYTLGDLRRIVPTAANLNWHDMTTIYRLNDRQELFTHGFNSLH